MPASYPNSIYSPRTKENKADVVYKPEKTTIGFVEDITKLDDEVVAVETALSGLNCREVIITPAQLLDIVANPIEVVPAPGEGKVLEFISAVVILDFNTIAYEPNGAGIALAYLGGATVGALDWDSLIMQGADRIHIALAIGELGSIELNKSIVLWAVGGNNPTLGDSPLKIRINYRVHATGL